MAAIAISTVIEDRYLGGATIKSALVGVFSAVLGAATVGILWEYSSKREFTEEIETRLQTIIERVAVDTAITSDARREGLLLVTSDFHNGVPWDKYIAEADSIEVYWWAGRTWIKSHEAALRQKCLPESGFLRVYVPDVELAAVRKQMSKDSGRSEATIRSATNEAISLLDDFPEHSVVIQRVNRAPSYMYIKLGDRSAFSTYPHGATRNNARPVFVCTTSGLIGTSLADDFARILTE